MCIRTVMTYASPVFAHAAQKHYIDYRTHRSDSSTSRDHIPMRLRAAVDYQPPHPTHLIRRPRNVLTDPPDALTAAVESLNDEGREPVTVSCDILCRDDFHQASSIAHVTRRRHSHVPSGRTRIPPCARTNSWGKNQPSRAAPEPPRETTFQEPYVLPPAPAVTDPAASFGKDIKTVMSFL
ncbi:hypothetical protein EVAR_94743_1 [Eumeta japonica]|uniref:Uncharacterized protein n=1 Tax=Eumeta variegata TaxID=151549 RepID=A0A4C1UX49_EUMVA|nr:hypothetical protein EVAR_94743_1 [Eumeta japonica]